jgi:hypothetical protein
LENYGTVTAILTHVVQHVCITPIVMNSQLNQDLKDLRFDAISVRFGCFFLHDLDLTNGYLPPVCKLERP